MKNFSKALEQRIFIFYFLITLILVLFIILLEWQLVRFGIKQSENQNIFSILNSYEKTVTALANKKEKHLYEIVNLLENDNSINKNNIESIINILKYDKKEEVFFVFDKNDDLILGEMWDLINSYYKIIIDDSHLTNKGHFTVVYGKKSYLLSYLPIIAKNKEYIGTILNVYDLNYSANISAITYDSVVSPYPFRKNILPKAIKPYFKNALTYSQKKIANKITKFIFKPNYSYAMGFYINYTPIKTPTSAYIYFYRRNINAFAQQSIWFFVLILTAVSLLMIVIFGNWFSKTILHPVKLLSVSMQKISLNPEALDQIPQNYKGVLGDMLQAFNRMNTSLQSYGDYLKEYKIATDNIENGILWLNENFEILLYNDSLNKILGNDESLKGRSFLQYINLSDNEKKHALEDTLTIPLFQYQYKNKVKYLIINLKSVIEKSRKIIIGGITDITSEIVEKKAREALELELIKSNKLAEIGRRVEGVVHNMNSPLNSVIGYAQLLRKDIGNNSDLEKILNSGKLIAHYIKTLQQKIRNDHASMYQPLDLNKLIKDELELFKHNLFFKHYVTLTTSYYDNLPKVQAVYGDISMCITNIINNAIEAMETSKDKLLTISTNLNKNNEIEIKIEDSGIGIAADNLTNIFEPYYTTKSIPKGSGYGLGLAIASHIAKKYHGKISVTSQLNKGSTFIISIPINQEINDGKNKNTNS